MMTWLEVLKVSNSHVWPRVGHDLVPTLTLSSPSVHDQYFVPSPELELWQNVGLFSWPPVSGISNTMSQNVGGSEREAEIIMFFCEKSVFDIMSWFAICHVSFQNIQTNMNHANTSQARLGPQQTQFLRWISQFLKIFPRPIYWKWLYYNSHIQEKLFARKLLHVQTNLGIRFLHLANMNINQRWDSPFSTLPEFLFSRVRLVSLCMFVNK